MITHSGILVMPLNQGAPSLEDIAVSLGRTCRFRGNTKRWWSVLQHSLLCHTIALEFHGADPRMQLLVILHDAHEAVFGDIPTTWKTDAIRRDQAKMDSRIWKSLGIPHATLAEEGLVRVVDKAALLAEAEVLGPPGILDYYHVEPPLPHKDIVRHLCNVYPSFEDANGPKSAGVHWFVTLVTRRLQECGYAPDGPRAR